MKMIRLTIYTSVLTLERLSVEAAPIIKHIISKYTTYKREFDVRAKKSYFVLDRTYFAYVKATGLYHFNINSVPHIFSIFKYHKLTHDNFEIINKTDEVAKYPVKFKVDSKYKLRGYQGKYVKRITESIKLDYYPIEMINRLVDLETGRGKTVIAAFALLKLKMRFGIVVLPKYFGKWIDDIQKLTDIREEEIFLIQGSASINELIEEVNKVGAKNLKYRAFLFSNKTLQLYITEYMTVDTLDEFSYSVEPLDLMKHIGISTLLNDETHQEFHSIFIMLCFFNISNFIGLSATLDTHDSKLRQMYDTLFPGNGRISNIAEFTSYINIIAVMYYVTNPKRIRYRTNKGYSNIIYEQSLMKNTFALRDFINMIIFGLENYYLDIAEKGDKCLIFCSTVDMCNIVKNYLKVQFPNKDIRTYTSDDPYENIMEADITISTHISSGTALDIKGLITVLQTINMGSMQANLQSIGRLREILGKDVRYVYFYANNIQPHRNYHYQRKELFRNKAKTYGTVMYKEKIRT